MLMIFGKTLIIISLSLILPLMNLMIKSMKMEIRFRLNENEFHLTINLISFKKSGFQTINLNFRCNFGLKIQFNLD